MLFEKVNYRMRSKLFVPAIRPDLFPKAMASDADAVCFDLEEGVAAERKLEARKLLSEFLHGVTSSDHPVLLVRVNPASSADLPLDLEAVVRKNVAVLALPKVEEVVDVQHVDGRLSRIERQRGFSTPIPLLLTIESPRGLRLAAELAQSSPRVIGLQLGFADLLEPLGISSTDSAARNQIRLMLRLAAAEAGVACFESAYLLLNDDQGFLAQLQDARSLGFVGVSCIHPRQVSVANRVFTPTAAEIEYAEGIIEAVQQAERKGSAIAQFHGKMIDRPLVLRARQILSYKVSK